MARLKAEMGFRATYFLLFTVAYYNLLSEEHCGVPRDLVTLGHDVGLRYDLQVFSRMGAGVVERAIEFQARLLEETAGRRARLERVVEEAVRSLRDRTACQKQIWTVFLAARESRSPGEAGGSGGAP